MSLLIASELRKERKKNKEKLFTDAGVSISNLEYREREMQTLVIMALSRIQDVKLIKRVQNFRPKTL